MTTPTDDREALADKLEWLSSRHGEHMNDGPRLTEFCALGRQAAAALRTRHVGEREVIANVIDKHKLLPWTVDRANQMADEILAALPTIAEAAEARDYYAGLYAERCGQLAMAQQEVAEARARGIEALLIAMEPFALAGEHIKGGRGVWVEKPFDGQVVTADFNRAAEVYATAIRSLKDR